MPTSTDTSTPTSRLCGPRCSPSSPRSTNTLTQRCDSCRDDAPSARSGHGRDRLLDLPILTVAEIARMISAKKKGGGSIWSSALACRDATLPVAQFQIDFPKQEDPRGPPRPQTRKVSKVANTESFHLQPPWPSSESSPPPFSSP